MGDMVFPLLNMDVVLEILLFTLHINLKHKCHASTSYTHSLNMQRLSLFIAYKCLGCLTVQHQVNLF